MSNELVISGARFKHNEIAQALRQQIISGALPPGGKLPTREEMELIFKASQPTLQKAMETLKRDRFVEIRGRRGTYVAQHPPHLCRYAIAFPHKRRDAAS